MQDFSLLVAKPKDAAKPEDVQILFTDVPKAAAAREPATAAAKKISQV